jgi:hypothetical protein
MKQTIIVPQLEMKDRDPLRVDAIVGKKRKSVKDGEPIDFSECQLAKRYPDINDYLEEVHRQRIVQKSGGPLAHPRVIAPVHRRAAKHFNNTVLKKDPPPWEAGPTAADVRRAYETTHRGR